MRRTSERNLPTGGSPEDSISRDRHRFAYESAAQRLTATDDVLDVGCGEGYGAPILLGAGRSYVGIDLSEAVVGEARGNFGSDRARFSAFDGARIPLDDAAFDAAVSFQVIEHVTDVSAYLTEIRRVLRPTGWVMFTTPNRLLRLGPGESPWNRFHLREYDPQGLADDLGRVFPSVRVLGVRASPEAEAIEIARVQRARRWARWDVLDLRNRLPGALNDGRGASSARSAKRAARRSTLRSTPRTMQSADSICSQSAWRPTSSVDPPFAHPDLRRPPFGRMGPPGLEHPC